MQFLPLWIFPFLFLTTTLANEAFQPQLTQDFPHLLGIDRLNAWMNPDVDPCSDFYKYACGGFVKRYTGFKNHGKNSSDVVKLMGRSSSLLMSMILNQTSDPMATNKFENEIFTKTRDYYQSCVRRDIITSKGFNPIKPFANLILKKFDDKKKPLIQILAELQGQVGIKVVFHSKYSSVPSHNLHELRLQLVPAPAYKMSLQTIEEIMDSFVDNGIISEDNVDLDKVNKWIHRFEKRHLNFAQKLNHKKKRKDSLAQYQSIESLNQETEMDWSLYLKALKLEGVKKAHLWADSPTWLKEFAHLQQVDREMLKYYSLYRLAVAHFNKLPNPYYKLWDKKIRKKAIKMRYYSVDKAMTFLRHDCVKETGANLKYLAGHIYVKYAFNNTQKALAEDMVDNLFETLRHRFTQLDWMDHSSKKAAIKKLDSMVRIVGFPEWVMDAEQVDEYYRPLKFKFGSYLENAIQAQIFTELMPSIHHSRTGDVERDDLFKDFLWQLNAMHLVNLVQIQINPGFLQRPLFSELNPSAMNYGSLGGVIGHEMTHAFDSFGSQFNWLGERKPWMTPKSQMQFNRRAQCFVKQYSRMSATLKDGTKKRINGRHTLTENIADNGGMHTAFAAWKVTQEGKNIYKKESKNDQFTPAQIFWLAYAQTNCDVSSDKKIKRQLKKDVHSPKPARVNGALRNSVEFSKAFQCKLHSPMRPLPVHKTCRIL